ncbi:hypothetical protein D3C74_287000 [compost metagenome]
MLRAKAPAARRSARLEDRRGALDGRLGKMDARHVEVLAVMVNRMHLGRVGVDATFAVLENRVFLP